MTRSSRLCGAMLTAGGGVGRIHRDTMAIEIWVKELLRSLSYVLSTNVGQF